MSLLTTARAHLKTILNTEFGAEPGFSVVDSWLHAGEGLDGPIAGTFPLSERPQPGNMLVNNADIGVQVFRRWEKDIDMSKRVDPAAIEAWAKRFKDRCRTTPMVSSNRTWYFNVGTVDFVPDPTGHRTRFEATVTVYGDNNALVETSG